MKKLLLLLFVGIVGIGNAQNVYIPDANFKANLVWSSNINTNGDAEIQVSEAAAFNGGIGCDGYNISNLMGIEAFTALTALSCSNNQLTSLDVTQNTALTELRCTGNQLTSLDVTQNTALTEFWCYGNQLTSLDVTQNTTLQYLRCEQNQLTSLDVTQNTALTELYCSVNQLTCLNVKNGNNLNVSSFYSSTNPNLNCVEVDDPTWSTTNWLGVDAQTSFSTNCNNPCSIATDILESSLSNLSLYPNPSNTGLIQLNTSITNSDINVYSIEGKQIKFTQSNNVIDISDNEKGVYLISIDGVVMRYVYQE